MKRRERREVGEEAMPPHLLEFDPGDWPPPNPEYCPDPTEWDRADWVRKWKRLKWNSARRLWCERQRGLHAPMGALERRERLLRHAADQPPDDDDR